MSFYSCENEAWELETERKDQISSAVLLTFVIFFSKTKKKGREEDFSTKINDFLYRPTTLLSV